MSKVVLASHNAGKLQELQFQLKNYYPESSLGQAEWLSIADFTQQKPLETGLSYVENALLKARFASEVSGLPALADDSGLSVKVLEGAPGIYSSRYAGEQATDEDNWRKLLQQMQGQPDRQACFHCALVWLSHATDPAPKIALGRWCGEIAEQPRGCNGFGYDCVLFLPSYGCCVAELSEELKNQISHRAQALQSLLANF